MQRGRALKLLAPKPCRASSGGPFGDGRPALWGLPISVKDCFDLAGSPTTCGVHFYRDLNGNATRDSWLVEQLRAAGAVIIGKTHLHPLAYGITGENPEFGDCVQPRDAGALTGGSSSGAAASVQEGSAVAAIGTDTGGSVRAPAALCGLAGYRATLGRGDWRGGAHLAESFDTMGWLFRDLEDAPLLAAPFAPGSNRTDSPLHQLRLSSPTAFSTIASRRSIAGFRARRFANLQALGLEARTIDHGVVGGCRRNLRADPGIGGGAHSRRQLRSISSRPFANGSSGARASRPAKFLRCASVTQHFRARMDELFAAHQLILLPCDSRGAPRRRRRPQPDPQPPAALHRALQPRRRAHQSPSPAHTAACNWPRPAATTSRCSRSPHKSARTRKTVFSLCEF